MISNKMLNKALNAVFILSFLLFLSYNLMAHSFLHEIRPSASIQITEMSFPNALIFGSSKSVILVVCGLIVFAWFLKEAFSDYRFRIALNLSIIGSFYAWIFHSHIHILD